MARWSHYDTDEERLPAGMERIGYDADDETYTFRDADGSIWASAPGNRYGPLTRISGPPAGAADDDDDDDAPGETARDPFLAAAPKTALSGPPSWRQEMAPLLSFFMLVGLFLLGVFWFLSQHRGPVPVPAPVCDGALSGHDVVRSGDTCWDIAQRYGIDLEAFVAGNKHLHCENLQPGTKYCVPGH